MNPRKIMIVALLILVAAISFTKIAPWAADPVNHKHSIEQTEDKIASVLTLSGGAAATSATLSILPGDMCTPLADQLAELAKYFLLILSSLYLEKFLISLSGYITFMFLVPIACLILCIAVVLGKRSLVGTAWKMALVGLIIFLIVPASVWLSDKVYQTQSAKVNTAIEEYNELEIQGDSDGGFINEITSLPSESIESVTSFIDGLMESLAVMIVTSCVIPLLVFIFLIWLVRLVFSANILTLDSSVLDMVAEKLG